jgi:hypothetical protein
VQSVLLLCTSRSSRSGLSLLLPLLPLLLLLFSATLLSCHWLHNIFLPAWTCSFGSGFTCVQLTLLLLAARAAANFEIGSR